MTMYQWISNEYRSDDDSVPDPADSHQPQETDVDDALPETLFADGHLSGPYEDDDVDDDDVIELELFHPEDDEETTDDGAIAWRGSIPGLLAAAVFHVWLVFVFQSIIITEKPSPYAPPIDSRLENTEIPVEPEQIVEYQLANPDDKQTEVREIVNAASVGASQTNRPVVETQPEPIDDLLPTERPQMYDIPEGMEVDERIVVKGTTGEALIQMESALDRVTWEIARNLQERKVLAVWLLDASGSLDEQRKIIAKRLKRIYGELDALEDVGQVPRLEKALISGVVGYGTNTNFMTPEPTDRFELVRDAVRNLPVDESGRENVFTAVSQVMGRWSKYRASNGRRIMLIIVTDETGDDFGVHETAIARCRRFGAKAYVVGPYAVFGRRKGYVPYVAPENGKTYRLPVDLGPETVMYDSVELPFWFDGPQYTYLASGFGPYALSRLVHETGGVYFTTNMTTMAGLSTVGYFKAQMMKPFSPDYSFGTREDYEADLRRHPIRWVVVRAAQLSRDNVAEGTPQLQLRVTPQNYRQVATSAQETVARSQLMIDRILAAFPAGIEEAYDAEPSPRWRMAFNVAFGRLLAQKVRCLEYNYALAELKGGRTPQDIATKSNRWIFRPDKDVNFAGGVEKRMADKAEERLQLVLDEAPGTPWALLAARELRNPFGIRVIERFVPPPPPRSRNTGPRRPPKPRLLLAPEPKAPQQKPKSKPKPPKLPKL